MNIKVQSANLMSVVVTYVSIPYVCNGNLPEHTYVHSGNLKYVSILNVCVVTYVIILNTCGGNLREPHKVDHLFPILVFYLAQTSLIK